MTQPDLRALLDEAVEALEIADSWLNLWAPHIANCVGGSLCTCGLTRVRHDAETTLARIKSEQQQVRPRTAVVPPSAGTFRGRT